ncbi:MAG: oxidoreductase [Erythrobacter sp.]|nr:oxidoreductase [Erythrobacter sp.]
MADRFAVVTGASTGIGYELARRAAEDGYTLLICADEPAIEEAAGKLRRLGASVEAFVTDLATTGGFEALWDRIGEREIDLFFANAGRALGHAFYEQDWTDIQRRIDLNTVQTTLALHRVGQKMARRGEGRILVTGSIGGFVPGPFDGVYNATKAYLDSLCYALQDEWKGNGVTLTCLMPGPTETPIFTRGQNRLRDAPITDHQKDDPAEVARAGYDAMMAGERGVVPGFASKVITMLSGVVPESVKARIHRWGAEPE